MFGCLTVLCNERLKQSKPLHRVKSNVYAVSTKYTVLDKVEQHLMRSIYSYILANKRKVEFDTDYLKLRLLLKRL